MEHTESSESYREQQQLICYNLSTDISTWLHPFVLKVWLKSFLTSFGRSQRRIYCLPTAHDFKIHQVPLRFWFNSMNNGFADFYVSQCINFSDRPLALKYVYTSLLHLYRSEQWTMGKSCHVWVVSTNASQWEGPRLDSQVGPGAFL